MSPVFACVFRYTCLECVSYQNRIALSSSHFEVPPQRFVPSSSSRRHEYGGEKREKTRCDWFNDSVEKGVGGGWGESSSAPEALNNCVSVVCALGCVRFESAPPRVSHRMIPTKPAAGRRDTRHWLAGSLNGTKREQGGLITQDINYQ